MGSSRDYERYRRAGQQAYRNSEAYRRRIAQIRRRRLALVLGIAALFIGLVIFGVRGAVRAFRGSGTAEGGKTVRRAEGLTKAADSTEAGMASGEGSPEDSASVSALDGYITPAAELPPEGRVFSAKSEDAAYFVPGYSVQRTSAAQVIPEDWTDCNSSFAILVDLSSNTVVADKNAAEVISPASMTKILTLLTAVDMITDLQDTFTVTIEVTDYCFSNDCSAAGFALDETVTVEDLLYGLILPSGGDAAYALALYCSGSMESFAEAMNAKVRELGLSEHAHFTNSAGLYDDGNHCTVADMAMILKAAVENELCREVLSRHIYTTSSTEQHPEGIELSNWFLRKIEDKDCHGEVACAKTGFVNESGCCAASYQISNSGKRYICVTGNAWSSWRCIYDHVAIYDRYTK